MNASKTESIINAITKVIDNNDTDSAIDLVEYWDSKFPLEDEGRCIFYYTKLRVFLKCHELAKDSNAKVEYLAKAIEAGNNFFKANEAEDFPMDTEVKSMWFELIDLSAQLVAFYSESTYDDEEEELDEYLNSPEMDQTDIFTEAIYSRIGKINRPNLKPQPSRLYDDSIRGKLLKAIDHYIEEHGDLDSCEVNLLRNICVEFDISFDDFFNDIYDY